MCSSLWFMESQVAIRTPQLAVSTVLEISGKHFSENMMRHSLWREQSMDGWNAFILASLLPQREKVKRITQYGCILNFPGGNKPLKIHTGDSVDLNNPLLLCWRKYVCCQSVIVSKIKSPHKYVLWFEKKEHKCIWQVIILKQSQLQSFKTVLTQRRTTTGTNMTHHLKPQF